MKILNTLVALLMTISLSLSGWSLSETVDLRTKVAAMESNRFTNQDGLTVWMEIASIKQQIARHQERIDAAPNQAPPAWFVDQIKSMENRFSIRMDKLEQKIDAAYNR